MATLQWLARKVVIAMMVCAAASGFLFVSWPVGPTAASTRSAPSTRIGVDYAPPVIAEVIDPFRPPAHVGAPGNRGLEYGDTDTQVVAAAADGRVVFVGPVAGRQVVTIEHGDGVRTTYTGLAEIWVEVEQDVTRHSAIAVAGGNLHFGARIRDHYLDPQVLIDASSGPVEPRPRLIPPPADAMQWAIPKAHADDGPWSGRDSHPGPVILTDA